MATQLWAARHVRRNLEALERNFARRLAVGEADDNDERDRPALCQFRDSLAPPTSRLVVVGLFVAGAVLAQKLLDALPELLQAGPVRDRAKNALKGSARRPAWRRLRDLLDAIVDSSVIEFSIFAAAVCWSGYVLTRALAGGYRWRTWPSAAMTGSVCHDGTQRLSSRAAAWLRVRRRRPSSPRLVSPPPRELPFDLIVKALLCAPFLIFIGGFFRASAEEGYLSEQAPLFAAMFALVACRLLVLGLAARKRGSDTTWLLLPLPLVALACIAPPIYPPEAPEPKLSQSQSLRLTLSTRQDLTAVDLREQDLQEFYLYAKNLSHAQLTNANLTAANLMRSRLLGAQLRGATLIAAKLRGANLREANLSVADLREADLRGTDLRGANLTGAFAFETDLRDADLRGARLSSADLDHSDLRRADLRGLDLREARGLKLANLAGVRYDRSTRWPVDIDKPLRAALAARDRSRALDERRPPVSPR